jgi:hypothetical protein
LLEAVINAKVVFCGDLHQVQCKVFEWNNARMLNGITRAIEPAAQHGQLTEIQVTGFAPRELRGQFMCYRLSWIKI